MGKKKSDNRPPSFMHIYPDIQKEHPVPDYVKKVDDFVEHYFSGDYVVDTARAFNIPYSIDRQESTLGHYLTFLLPEYEASKTKTFQDSYWCAYLLFQLITHAFAVDVIKKGDGLITKLKNYEEQNKQLKETKEKLENKVLKLEKTLSEYKRVLDALGKKVSDVGDESFDS